MTSEVCSFLTGLFVRLPFAQKALLTMHIPTGILVVPSSDDAATDAVMRVLLDADVDVQLVRTQAAPSQRNWITDLLIRWADEEEVDLILTIGGTYPAPGPSAAEIVPEATLEIIDRLLPGFSETMRAVAAEESPLALLDRSVVGIRGRTLIINLPAGAQSAALFLEPVADLIDAVLAHLRVEPNAPTIAADLVAQMPADGADDRVAKMSTGGLDAEEFAAFLQRTQKDEAEDQ